MPSPANTQDEGTEKATLYFRTTSPPNLGYGAEHIYLREHNLVANWGGGLGNVVAVRCRRRRRRPEFLFFGRDDALVIVSGWQKEFENYTTIKAGIVTTKTSRFLYGEEWSAFATFLKDLQDSGARIIADFRQAELGNVSPLGIPRGVNFSHPAPLAPLAPPLVSPDEIYSEGAVATVVLDQYERSAAARRACLAYHGRACKICGFDFAILYPGIGDGFIEVHHLTPPM